MNLKEVVLQMYGKEAAAWKIYQMALLGAGGVHIFGFC